MHSYTANYDKIQLAVYFFYNCLLLFILFAALRFEFRRGTMQMIWQRYQQGLQVFALLVWRIL